MDYYMPLVTNYYQDMLKGEKGKRQREKTPEILIYTELNFNLYSLHPLNDSFRKVTISRMSLCINSNNYQRRNSTRLKNSQRQTQVWIKSLTYLKLRIMLNREP